MDIKVKLYIFILITLTLGTPLLPIILTPINGSNIYEFFFLAYLISLPVALGFVALRGKLGDIVHTLKDPRKAAIICATGALSYFPLVFGVGLAERYLGASLTVAIFRTAPLLSLLFLPSILKERLTKYQIAALMLAFAGLYIGVTGGGGLGLGAINSSDIDVTLFLVAMTFAYALSNVLVKKYMIDISVFIFFAVASTFAIFAVLYVAAGVPTAPIISAEFFPMFWVVFMFNIVLYYMYYSVLRQMKTTLVLNIYFLSAFLTFIYASVFLSEPIKLYYIAIAALGTLGVVIQSFDKIGGSHKSSVKNPAHKNMTMFDVTGIFANTGEVAINNTLRDGGRILAVKLPNEYSGHVNTIMGSGSHPQVYTDSNQTILGESKFVKDIVGARDGEFVVMKAGKLDECEGFFDYLQQRIKEPAAPLQ